MFFQRDFYFSQKCFDEFLSSPNFEDKMFLLVNGDVYTECIVKGEVEMLVFKDSVLVFSEKFPGEACITLEPLTEKHYNQEEGEYFAGE